MKMSLVQLPISTVKLITSSQIITCISSVVKELFENALDAGATSIDVKLVNYGLDRIEVKDNGSGIMKENTACMALPHFTSKIADFSDLESLNTYGFRGEALNALCQVGQVSITTATSKDQTATVYTLDSLGNVTGMKPSPHVQGTTVVVLSLFKNLPVRRQLMGSNRKAQEELKQVETVVKALAIIKPSIRVTLIHNKCLIWQKNPSSTLLNSFSQVIGYATSQQLEQMSFPVNSEVHVDMLIPKRNCDIAAVTKSTPSLSLVFVNNRPVTYKKITKIFQQTLAGKFGDNFPSRKFVTCVVCLTLAPSNVDVNLEPNKTKVLLKDEDVMISEITKKVQGFYSIPEIEQQCNSLETRPMKQQLIFDDDAEDDLVQTKKRKVDSESCKPALVGFESHSHTVDLNNKASCDENVERKTGCNREVYFDTGYLNGHTSATDARDNSDSITFKSAVDPEVMHPEKESISLQRAVSGIIDHTPQSDSQPETHFDSSTSPVPSLPTINSELSCIEELPQTSLSEKYIDTQEGLYASHEEPNNEMERETVPQPCINSRNQSELMPDPPNLVNVSGNEADRMDQCQDDILTELVECLDVLESDPIIPGQMQQGVDLIGTEAWSMGHVTDHKAEPVKGSCVLVGGLTAPLFGQLHPSPPNNQSNKLANLDVPSSITEDGRKLSPQKNFKGSPSKSPRGYNINGTSPGLDNSLQSVSSQMGRRELAAFTKFAREIRPQIILENPGIPFTHVASLLAEKWQSLSEEEREHYEEKARETATTKKIWKTCDKQKRLDWVKRLPTIEEKKTTPQVRPVCHNRPPRKEVQFSISISRMKKNCSTPSSDRWQDDLFNSSTIHLLGRLEPSGTWVCMDKSSIVLVNHGCLQEVVLYHQLLNTHTLQLKPLTSKELLNQDVLGDEAWKTLLSLPCSYDNFRQTNVVSADILMKNGFRIEMRADKQSAALTEVADVLNFYGLKELKETLHLGKNWPNVQLFECRPLRVASHIKSETMRICRKSPAILERTMMQELLEYWKTIIPDKTQCLHAKPILMPVYDIVEKISLLDL